MSLSSIVSVSITANTRTPTRVGFGTPLLLGYDAGLTAGTMYTGTELSDVTAAGASASGSIYKMAEALLSQNPRPESFKFATISAVHTQTSEITVTSATEGQHVKLTIVSPSGTESAIDYTIGAAATTTTVATALELLIEAVTGISSTSSGAVVTATAATPGQVFGFHSFQNCTFKDVTGDGAYDTMLSTLLDLDSDFYAVLIDVNSEVNIDDVAAWVETRSKIFVAQTQDYGEKAGTGTIGSGLKTAGYDNTLLLFVDDCQEYGACALVGAVLPWDPGSATWAFKELDGVTPSDLTATHITNLEAQNTAYYHTVAGLNVTRVGKAAGGEFLDVTQGIHWLTARLQERIFAILANARKVPYSDASVDMFVGEIMSQLEDGVRRGFLLDGTLTASGPKVADVDTADRAARHLPDLKFGAQLAGAVHKVTIAGTISV